MINQGDGEDGGKMERVEVRLKVRELTDESMLRSYYEEQAEAESFAQEAGSDRQPGGAGLPLDGQQEEGEEERTVENGIRQGHWRKSTALPKSQRDSGVKPVGVRVPSGIEAGDLLRMTVPSGLPLQVQIPRAPEGALAGWSGVVGSVAWFDPSGLRPVDMPPQGDDDAQEQKVQKEDQEKDVYACATKTGEFSQRMPFCFKVDARTGGVTRVYGVDLTTTRERAISDETAGGEL